MTTQTSRLVIEIDSRNAERNTRAVANELENLTKKGDQAETQMTAMSASIKSLVGYMGGILTINKAIAMADGYTQMAARIRNATTSAEEYDLVQNRVLATANTTYRALSEAQEVYLSLSGGMRSLGKTTTQTLDLVDSLSFSFTHNATRTDQAQSAMDSLSKSMAKGKIDADAWISIVTGADNVIADMAKTTGKTEAEIRKLGAEGKASLEDLIQTLIATREQNEKLANNMENSLADGFATLSNAVTVYLGKANESTSATGIMAGALGELAKNLELVANVAMLGGVAYLTKRIAEQTVAIRGSIAASTAKKVALETEVASQLKLLAVEVQRSRQTAAQTLTEINLARAELNSATTRDARAAATMRLTQAEVAHNIALKHSAVAVATQVTAEANLAATRTAGARALALVGGPIGAITIGVTALAAGYMLLSDNSEKSTKSLRDNNEAVGDAIVKYRELNGIQRDAQMAAERQKLDDLNEAYRKASAELMVYASNMSNLGEVVTESQVELSKLFAEYKKTGDLNAFNTAVQNSSKVSQDAKDKTANFAKAVFEAGAASKTQKEFIAQLSGELNGTANAGNSAAAGFRNLTSALTEINTKLSADVFSAKLQNAFEKQGKSAQSASRWTEVYNENAKKGFKGVTIEQKKMLDQLDAVDKQRDARQKAAQASASALTKASKAALTQQKKEAKELERDTRQALEDAKSLIYDYTSEFTRIETDLKNEIEKINNSSLKSGSKTKMIADATEISEARKKLYAAELDFELNEYNLSESEKLSAQTNIKKLRIDSTKGLLANERKLKKDSTEKESAHELGLIQLAKEQRIFQAEQAMMTEIQFMKERYRLEREEIIKTTATDLEERKRKLNALNTNTIRDGVGKNFSDPDDRGSQFLQSVDYAPISKSNSQRLDEEFEKEQAKMLANFEKVKQLNADNHEAILEAERIFLEAKQQLQDEYDFKAQDARRLDYENQLNMYGSLLSLTGGVFDELSGIVSQYKDENTKTYKTMFAFQKAAAFAQAIVSTELAAIQVMADPTALTLAQKQMHANIIRLTGYASAGIIAAQAFMGPGGDGYANGGFTGYGGKFDPAGIVHKGEVVWSQEDIKRWGGVNVVEAMRTSQPPAGYSDGGIVNPRDTYRVGMGTVEAINRNSDVQAERQAQASAKSQQSSSNGLQGLTIINQIEQDDLVGGYLRKPAAGQLILNLIKASPSEFKRALGVS